jgi:hypothetical protein
MVQVNDKTVAEVYAFVKVVRYDHNHDLKMQLKSLTDSMPNEEI